MGLSPDIIQPLVAAALAGEDGTGAAFEGGNALLRLGAVAVGSEQRDNKAGVHLTERLRDHVQTADDAGFLRVDVGPGAGVFRDGGVGGHVAAADVLGESGGHERLDDVR